MAMLEDEGWPFAEVSGSAIMLVASDWLDSLGTSGSGTDCLGTDY